MITVVYYTANREPPAFEAEIRRRLASVSPWPIISVSQVPSTLGTNLCVGEHHACDANAHRQLQIGAEAAAPGWILAAEADALYPPAYFDPPLTADRATYHRYNSVWLLFRRGGFRRKAWSEGAQLVDRDVLLLAIQRALHGRREWAEPGDPKPPLLFKTYSGGWWGDEHQPVISCKTGFGLRAHMGTEPIPPAEVLPHWGSARRLRASLFRWQAVA